MYLFHRFVPCPMVIGEPASGKSSSLRLIHALIGGTFLSQSSGESVASELVKSTLPVCWDDRSHPNTLTNVLVSTFQGGGKQTKTGGNEVPRTTFLLTVNFKLDNDLRFVPFQIAMLLLPLVDNFSKQNSFVKLYIVDFHSNLLCSTERKLFYY